MPDHQFIGWNQFSAFHICPFHSLGAFNIVYECICTFFCLHFLRRLVVFLQFRFSIAFLTVLLMHAFIYHNELFNYILICRMVEKRSPNDYNVMQSRTNEGTQNYTYNMRHFGMRLCKCVWIVAVQCAYFIECARARFHNKLFIFCSLVLTYNSIYSSSLMQE